MSDRNEVQTASHNLIVMSLLLATRFGLREKPASGCYKIRKERQFNFSTL